MSSNFDFLKTALPGLHQHTLQAESLVYSAPRASCFYARFALEQAVLWLYDHERYLTRPFSDPKANTLGALIHEQTFKDNLPPGLFPKVRIIHSLGNQAVHQSAPVTVQDSLKVTEELFHFCYWLARYYSPQGRSLGTLNFDRDAIPQPAKEQPDLTLKQLQTLETQRTQAEELRRIAEAKAQQTAAELAAAQAEIQQLKAANQAVPDTHDYNEAGTRQYFIDVLLKEAGWPIEEPGWTEVAVPGMPNATGTGYADYVLWGDNGKPLAVIEAKRTKTDARVGQQQAKLYADGLEQVHQQRPVIFYTNGYEHWIWDDCTYPPRRVEGFLSKAELERIIFRRTHREPLSAVAVNKNIVNRSYQEEAIRRVTEVLERKGRKALLVMPTGTGKTRTAIALVELLMTANWVRRVLFLADRRALLTQAKRAFVSHLPQVTAIDLSETKSIDGANVVLSTYPTLFNAINTRQGSDRLFGVGYFDLVLVDEAHRSIYQKYRALFQYFDAFLVGLTATPRGEIDRNTYQVFELPKDNPTFAYELEDAIADGYLVPPRGVTVPFKFLRRGVTYAELTPEEQLEFEEKFQDEETGEIPDEINAAALNHWLFNINTVDQALQILMERGLKTEGGDKLGKTIIFARNHNHAVFIVERFDANYPHLKGQFARIIDNQSSYAQGLIDDFSDASKEPTIAVSVDMLDTGIDVPEVVNLVFFKPVYARVKFNQMIGRGTRLCPDLFGIGQDKTEFLVFDLCSNFDFFKRQLQETEQKLREPLTARLVKSRLELVKALAAQSESGTTQPVTATLQERGGSYAVDDPLADLRTTVLDDLHRHVASLEQTNFLVRPHWQRVTDFAQRDRWNTLSEADLKIIAEHLAPLPNTLPRENQLAKEFDLLCLKLQLALLKTTADFIPLRDKVQDLMGLLEAKQTIPAVKAQLPLIEAMQSDQWWSNLTVTLLEQARKNLRDLIRFIDKQSTAIVYTDFQDELGEISDTDVPLVQTGFSPHQYRRKVEQFIRAHENHIAINKLKRNLPLTAQDLEALESMLFSAEALENREVFEDSFQEKRDQEGQVNLQVFIRELVGLDRNAAKAAFSEYLDDKTFSANQIRFVENIIDRLTQQGVMDPGLLFQPPYTNFSPHGIDGIFEEADADQIIAIVRSFNETVGKAFTAA
ncbi:MAG: DEAD/DEAH box helicase family protein [Prochlorotrichaceae cyanobacterium]